jgi:hypothetical protein
VDAVLTIVVLMLLAFVLPVTAFASAARYDDWCWHETGRTKLDGS